MSGGLILHALPGYTPDASFIAAELDLLGVGHGLDALAGSLDVSSMTGWSRLDAHHWSLPRPSGGAYWLVTDTPDTTGGWRAWIVGVPGAPPPDVAGLPFASTPLPQGAPLSPRVPAPKRFSMAAVAIAVVFLVLWRE